MTAEYLILQLRPAPPGPNWWPRDRPGGSPAWVTMYTSDDMAGGWTLGDVADEDTVLPASENDDGGRVDDVIGEWLEDHEDDGIEWQFTTVEVVPE